MLKIQFILATPYTRRFPAFQSFCTYFLDERKAMPGRLHAYGQQFFFIRQDLLKAPLVALTSEQAFVVSPCRESRNSDGDLAFLSPEEEQKILSGLPLVQPSVD